MQQQELSLQRAVEAVQKENAILSSQLEEKTRQLTECSSKLSNLQVGAVSREYKDSVPIEVFMSCK